MIRSSASVGGALSAFATLPGWLTAISDPEAVRTALRRHVPELASGELELRDCQVERVRFKPGSRTALYRLTLAGPGPGQERVVELLGEILGQDAPEPRPGPNGAAFADEDWRCYLPELRLDLGLQPSEATLPAVSVLTDPEEARGLLEQAIRSGSPAYANLRIQAARPRVVRAKASRCTVVYELDFAHEAGDAGSPTPVVAKTYRGSKGENAYAGMQALWSSKLGTSAAVAVAEPLAFVPELNVLVQGPVFGEATLKGLIRSAFAAGTPEALGELSAYVDMTAVGLGELHTSGVTYGGTVTWADMVADVEETLGRVVSIAPELAAAAAPLLARLSERAAEEDPPDPHVPTHGSFRPNQVLLNDGEIGFIDFDRFGQAEPGLDVASFLAAMKDAGRLESEPPSAADDRRARLDRLDELSESFLARYAALAPVSRERVALWEALALFTAVLDCWTKMEKGLDARLELLRHHLRRTGLAP